MFFCQPMFSTTWHQNELALVFTGHIFLNVEDLTCWTSCQGLLCSFNRDQTYKNNMCPAVRSRWWPCSCVSFVYFCIAKEQNLTVDQNYHHFFKQQSIPRNQKDTLYIIYYIYIWYKYVKVSGFPPFLWNLHLRCNTVPCCVSPTCGHVVLCTGSGTDVFQRGVADLIPLILNTPSMVPMM